MSEDIKVSVFCTTYNQEKYISRALESLVRQKTNFEFEILVHDDCSLDRTIEIIENYAQRYPQLIIPIYEKQNQYTIGNDIFWNICIPKARGKYIAICEGDDFWLDDQKLQVQFDAMEKNPEVNMCVCRAAVVTASDEREIDEIRPKKENSVLSTEEVILGGGRYIATATHFFKKSLFISKMNYEKVISFDYTKQIKGSLGKGILYIDRKMAAYRKDAENSWSLNVEKNKEKRTQHLQKEIAMLRELDKETNLQYHDAIQKRIMSYRPFIEQIRDKRVEILAELQKIKKPVYIWGLGMRGNACQEFCREEAVQINGICDIRNDCVGEKTSYGYMIEDTRKVLEEANSIIATNDNIYEVLKDMNYKGNIWRLQKYIPLS